MNRESQVRTLLSAVALIAIIVGVFSGSLNGAFLWDDDAHITANPCIVGPLGFPEIWTTAEANYFPLVLTNFWVQHAVWGLNPFGYHAVTVLFHAAAALLLWAVLRKVNVPAPWLGALLWAVHPVQVESVAWICELKNTQSAVFFLSAIWLFLKWLDGAIGSPTCANSPRRNITAAAAYLGALACAAAAILSKPSTVMLPIVLVILWWWRGHPIRLRALSPLTPFFALSAVAGLWTIWEQKVHSGASGAQWSQSILERVAIALRAPWFYLGKLVWPDLSFIYTRWSNLESSLAVFLPLTAAAVAVLLAFRRRPGPRAVALAGTYFVVSLFPILGFFSVYFFRFSFVSDHFQYLASIGPLALLTSALTTRCGRYGRVLAAIAVVATAMLSMERCAVFKDNEALWSDTVAKNPRATLALTQLGKIHAARGDLTGAHSFFLRAVQAEPEDFFARNDWGCALLTAGRVREAVAELRKAVDLDPRNPAGHDNLGRALQDSGDLGGAEQQYQESLRLLATANAHNNYGTLLNQRGDPSKAIEQFKEALRLEPNRAETHHNLANAYRAAGQLAEARNEYETALRLRDLPETHDDYGVALHGLGYAAEAIAQFEQAIRLNPALASAREHLASMHVEAAAQLGSKGQLDAALQRLDLAIAALPSFAAAHLNRGVALAQMNRWQDAEQAFQRAVQLDASSADAHRYVGLARANQGDLAGARAALETALKIDPESRQTREIYDRVIAARPAAANRSDK